MFVRRRVSSRAGGVTGIKYQGVCAVLLVTLSRGSRRVCCYTINTERTMETLLASCAGLKWCRRLD